MITRREALRSLAVGAAAAAFPTIVPSRALGLDGAVAPSERITLGVIGIGPRCTYVLTSMLGLGDAHCLAIADVQRTRRDAGKWRDQFDFGAGARLLDWAAHTLDLCQ